MTAALLCYRATGEAEMTVWADTTEATEAAQIMPCSKRCRGDHAVVSCPGGRFRVRTVGEAA